MEKGQKDQKQIRIYGNIVEKFECEMKNLLDAAGSNFQRLENIICVSSYARKTLNEQLKKRKTIYEEKSSERKIVMHAQRQTIIKQREHIKKLEQRVEEMR